MWGQSEMDDEFSKIVSSLQTDPKLPSWDTASRTQSVRRAAFAALAVASLAGIVLATALNSVILGVVCFIAAVCTSYLAYASKPVPRSLTASTASPKKAASRAQMSWYERLEKRWSDRQSRDW